MPETIACPSCGNDGGVLEPRKTRLLGRTPRRFPGLAEQDTEQR